MLAVLALLAGALLTAGLLDPGKDRRVKNEPAGKPLLVAWEAEDFEAAQAPMHRARNGQASGAACLSIDLGAGRPKKEKTGSARYRVQVPQAGRYRVWVRAWWTDACANSVGLSFGDGAPLVLGNDGTYHHWHWVAGPERTLAAGRQRITLWHREDGISIDQVLLSKGGEYVPEGLAATAPPPETAHTPLAKTPTGTPNPNPKPPLHGPSALAPPKRPLPENVRPPEPLPKQPAGPAGTHAHQAVSVPAHGASTPPPSLPGPPAARPFVAGIAGSYRDGFEGHLVSLGLPYIRLWQSELTDIKALQAIDLLIVSDPRCDRHAFYRTLYAFLKSGKTAIVESLPSERPPSPSDDPEDLFLQRGRGHRSRSFRQAILLSDHSKYFRGVPSTRAYHRDVSCRVLPFRTALPGAHIHGVQARGDPARKMGGALLVRKVGKGKLYYMALPAAFAAMWRERKVDPYVVNILRDACGNRGRFVYEHFRYEPKERGDARMSDDFMRVPGQKGGWKVLAGSFRLTGAARGGEEAFAVRGRGASAWVGTGHPQWKHYRPMASVKVLRGEAGIWYTTAGKNVGGGRLRFCLRAGGREAVLAWSHHGKDEQLASARVPGYPGGWRRLALLRRGGKTFGYVDGVRVLESGAPPEARGRAGLCVLNGEALFDDWRLVGVEALSPGRDVAPGEESSERCMERYYQRCFEKLGIYAPQWFCPPLPSDPARRQLPLPLFAGGTLQVDGGPSVPIPPGVDPPSVALPPGRAPAHDIAVHSATWRDYHFPGHVTDWYAGSGQWSQINRWSCSPTYRWYGGASRKQAVLWYKHEVSGPVAVEALMAPRADRRYGEERGRDLNLVLFGNGKDLRQGYLFTVRPPGEGCRISKGGRVLAQKPNVSLPSGHALHHAWFSVAAIAVAGKLRFYFDRRLVLECADPHPLRRGKVGIWTQGNKISLARATLSLGAP